MSDMTEFLAAVREGKIDEANALYEKLASLLNSALEQTGNAVEESVQLPEQEEEEQNYSDPLSYFMSAADALEDLKEGEQEDEDIEFAETDYGAVIPDVAVMDTAAVLPDKAVMEHLKTVRDMIRSAKADGKIEDKATLKAIAAKHKELLTLLIDNAVD